MDFWVKYGLYIAYGAGGLIGLALIIIGIVEMNKDKKLSRRKVFKAKVLNCIIGDNYIPGMLIQGFDIILEISTPRGNIRREIKRREPMDIGTTLEVYYDSKKDVIRFTDEVFDEEKKYPIILVAFGVFFLLLLLITFLAGKIANGKAVTEMSFGFLAGVVFIFIGIWLSFIRPHKFKKDMIHCEKVEGRIADTVRQGRTGDVGDRHRQRTYSYVYEYEYGGVKRTLKGRTSSNTYSHADIGRKVVIVINHKTGDVFCMDDEKTGVGMGIVFLIFGIATIPFVLLVTGVF